MVRKSMWPLIILDLKMDMLDNWNITSKHLSRKGLHLNKASYICLAKNIVYKLRKFCWSMEHLNESPARVSINISRPPISCESLNSNYTVSFKTFAKRVSGKMPPGKKPPGKMSPRKLLPGNKPPRKIASGILFH